MSIQDDLHQLECDKRIYRFEPKSRKAPKRRLYLTKHAQRQFDDDHSAVNILVGRGFIRAALTRWTTDGQIYAADNGRAGKFLKELDPPPPNIWEVRVTEPATQARLIGSFPEQDTLVLTDLYTRPHLGKKGSANWIAAMNKCATDWTELGLPTFRANYINEYVTENCDAFPLIR